MLAETLPLVQPATPELRPIWIGPVPYDAEARGYLDRSDHYLDNSPPGALFAIGVRQATSGLFGDPVGEGPLLGLCVIGRPVARALAQDGSVGEVARLHLQQGLPYGTASAVLRRAIELARIRGLDALISYHDRSRHTGCVYRKAGFRKMGATKPKTSRGGWGSRAGRAPSAVASSAVSKRRWRLDLKEAK